MLKGTAMTTICDTPVEIDDKIPDTYPTTACF